MAEPAGRLNRVYDKKEREIIDPFKEDYLKATSPAGRKRIALSLLPKLFQYWSDIGKPVPDEKMEEKRDVKLFSFFGGSTLTITLGTTCVGEKQLAHQEDDTGGSRSQI
jgi:hypothetical protein